jgi:hypothetical protein
MAAHKDTNDTSALTGAAESLACDVSSQPARKLTPTFRWGTHADEGLWLVRLRTHAEARVSHVPPNSRLGERDEWHARTRRFLRTTPWNASCTRKGVRAVTGGMQRMSTLIPWRAHPHHQGRGTHQPTVADLVRGGTRRVQLVRGEGRDVSS